MKYATERQKSYMEAVGIQYDEEITTQEATKKITEYRENDVEERHTMDIEP